VAAAPRVRHPQAPPDPGGDRQLGVPVDARRGNTPHHAVRHSRPRNTLQDASGPSGQEACIYMSAAGQARPEGPVEADAAGEGPDPGAGRGRDAVAGGDRHPVRGVGVRGAGRAGPGRHPQEPWQISLTAVRPPPLAPDGHRTRCPARTSRVPGSRMCCRYCRIRCRGRPSGRWPGSGCSERVPRRCSRRARRCRWPGCCWRCPPWPPPG
jgi:hypothetical protein